MQTPVSSMKDLNLHSCSFCISKKWHTYTHTSCIGTEFWHWTLDIYCEVHNHPYGPNHAGNYVHRNSQTGHWLQSVYSTDQKQLNIEYWHELHIYFFFDLIFYYLNDNVAIYQTLHLTYSTFYGKKSSCMAAVKSELKTDEHHMFGLFC